MIVRQVDDVDLLDQEALAVENGVSVRTVRRRCCGLQVACDVRTRAPLYDADAAAGVLAGVVARPGRAGGERGRWAFA